MFGFGKTSESLKEALMEFVNHVEFPKVTFRQNLQFLCDNLRYGGWIAMSHEELILRNHYDYLGAMGKPKAHPKEFFYHENLFMQLGIVPSVKAVARHEVEKAVQNLIAVGLLKNTRVDDPQMANGFSATMLADPHMDIDDAVYELRKRFNGNRA